MDQETRDKITRLLDGIITNSLRARAYSYIAGMVSPYKQQMWPAPEKPTSVQSLDEIEDWRAEKELRDRFFHSFERRARQAKKLVTLAAKELITLGVPASISIRHRQWEIEIKPGLEVRCKPIDKPDESS